MNLDQTTCEYGKFAVTNSFTEKYGEFNSLTYFILTYVIEIPF
jgi:hypothetical protein